MVWVKREFRFRGRSTTPVAHSSCLSRYSLLFASRGANIVINDFNAALAQKVVDEITKSAYSGFRTLVSSFVLTH